MASDLDLMGTEKLDSDPVEESNALDLAKGFLGEVQPRRNFVRDLLLKTAAVVLMLKKGPSEVLASPKEGEEESPYIRENDTIQGKRIVRELKAMGMEDIIIHYCQNEQNNCVDPVIDFYDYENGNVVLDINNRAKGDGYGIIVKITFRKEGDPERDRIFYYEDSIPAALQGIKEKKYLEEYEKQKDRD